VDSLALAHATYCRPSSRAPVLYGVYLYKHDSATSEYNERREIKTLPRKARVLSPLQPFLLTRADNSRNRALHGHCYTDFSNMRMAKHPTQ
jgi:hypothetical protein